MPAGVPASALSSVDSWFPDGTQLLIDSRQAGGHGSMWTVSLIGQSPRELRRDSKGWSVSPDGSLIAFSPYDKFRELWLMGSHGEGAKKILELSANEWFWAVRWPPDGQHLAYIRARGTDSSIETCDLTGTNRTTLVSVSKSDYWLADISWPSDGRILYALRDGPSFRDSSLWQVAVDAHSRSAAGHPRRITRWIGSNLLDLSASADGKRVVVRNSTSRAQAYLGELAAEGKSMNEPRRLSNNEAENAPSAWTSDSKSVLFASNRNGKWGIYKQSIAKAQQSPS